VLRRQLRWTPLLARYELFHRRLAALKTAFRGQFLLHELAPRVELSPSVEIWPLGVNTQLFRKNWGANRGSSALGDNFPSWDKVHPWGQLHSWRSKFTPRGEIKNCPLKHGDQYRDLLLIVYFLINLQLSHSASRILKHILYVQGWKSTNFALWAWVLG
jgi:hypothetical protein